MKLLIIECGTSKLPGAISAEVAKLKPKPESVSTMNITLERFNVPEFKNMLFHLSPDIIILDPPTTIEDDWSDLKWTALIKEVVRHNEMMSGRLVFVSSVAVLGDAQLRTEACTVMPSHAWATMLHAAEMLIEATTSRHYIMRFPDTMEDPGMRTRAQGTFIVGANESFTLIGLQDMAAAIVEKMQTGWFGKYHVTPNDYITLSDLVEFDWDKTKQVPNYSLMSKYDWKVAKSRAVWDRLVTEVKTCEASKT
jgi:dTDP-4-dehydrorhamnose reductase